MGLRILTRAPVRLLVHNTAPRESVLQSARHTERVTDIFQVEPIELPPVLFGSAGLCKGVTPRQRRAM